MKKTLVLLCIALSIMMLSCKPKEELPSVTTSFIIDITSNLAKCGGCVTSDGGLDVVSRGICWSTSQYPTKEDYYESAGGGIGEYKCELEDLEPNTTYYVRAYATNAMGTSYGEERSFTTLEPENKINGHEYVDLGLPSGLKWATCNVGAFSPEKYGYYFAWGETAPKAEYTEENSITYGEEMNDISGNPQYDAARANWGGRWRMPRENEMEELLDYCEWEWTQMNGVNGYKVIGHNGKSIFLPAAGFRDGSSLDYTGSDGGYWSSTPYDDYGDYDDNAYYLSFHSGGQCMLISDRFRGRSVRPVAE